MDYFASSDTLTHYLQPTASGKEQWVEFKRELDAYDDLILQGKLLQIEVRQEDGTSATVRNFQREIHMEWAEHQQAMLELRVVNWSLYRTDASGLEEAVPFSRDALRRIRPVLRNELVGIINDLDGTTVEKKDDSASSQNETTIVRIHQPQADGEAPSVEVMSASDS